MEGSKNVTKYYIFINNIEKSVSKLALVYSSTST